MNKRFIQHGIWIDCKSINRRTKKYIPMPLKLRELLLEKTIKFGSDVVEFTYGTIPDLKISVVAIVHPLDNFRRRAGYKIVQQRLDWAVKEIAAKRSINHKPWAHEMNRDGK